MQIRQETKAGQLVQLEHKTKSVIDSQVNDEKRNSNSLAFTLAARYYPKLRDFNAHDYDHYDNNKNQEAIDRASLLKLLLEAKANPNGIKRKMEGSPEYCIARQEFVSSSGKIFKDLTYGADIYDYNLLFMALRCSDVSTTRKLLEAKAKTEILSPCLPPDNLTLQSPLECAIELGFIKGVQLLLEYKANINFMFPLSAALTPLYLGYHRSILKDEFYKDLSRTFEIVKLLVEANADVNRRYSPKWYDPTPLKSAINIEINAADEHQRQIQSAHKINLIKLLLKAKADPNLLDPLSEALKQEDPEITSLLLDAKADATTGRHIYFFMQDMHSGSNRKLNFKKLQLLLKAEPSLKSLDGKGKTPLMMAVAKGLKEEVNLLLEWKADPNELTHTNWLNDEEEITALKVAVGFNVEGRDQKQDLTMIPLLLQYGARATNPTIRYLSTFDPADQSGLLEFIFLSLVNEATHKQLPSSINKIIWSYEDRRAPILFQAKPGLKEQFFNLIPFRKK